MRQPAALLPLPLTTHHSPVTLTLTLIRCANLLLSFCAEIKIADFGVAARIQQHAPEARDQPQGGGDAPVAVPGAAPGDASRTGTVMGTPLWMAPEMISDGIC